MEGGGGEERGLLARRGLFGSRKAHLHDVIASPIHLRDAVLALGTLQHPVVLQISACHQLITCCIKP